MWKNCIMRNINISLADISIALEVVYDETVQRFKEYLTDKTPLYNLVMTVERIAEEFLLLHQEYPMYKYTVIDAEFNAIYRDLTEILMEKDAFVFHALMIGLDNDGYVFTAPSGIGKSTHGKLWTEVFKDKVQIINGDKPILRIVNGCLYGYGSPWKGKENIGINSHVQIKSICHIVRGVNNKIHLIDNKVDSLDWFLKQLMLKNREKYLQCMLAWFKTIVKQVDLFELECNTEKSAVIVAYQAMCKHRINVVK